MFLTYSKSTNFQNGLNISVLHKEIEALNIQSAIFDGVVNEDDSVEISFDVNPSPQDVLLIDQVILNHPSIATSSGSVDELFPIGKSVNAKSDDLTTTTREDFIEKLKIDRFNVLPDVLPIGVYRVSGFYNWNHGWRWSEFELNVLVDGEYVNPNTGMEYFHHIESPSSDKGKWKDTGADQKYNSQFLFDVKFDSELSRDFSIVFRTRKKGRASSVWNASMFVERIG